jgi:hypothetical protein
MSGFISLDMNLHYVYIVEDDLVPLGNYALINENSGLNLIMKRSLFYIILGSHSVIFGMFRNRSHFGALTCDSMVQAR